MARVRTSLLLCLALLAPLAALAATPLRHGGSSSSSAVSGVYSVTFNLTIASTLPTGSTITCRAQIAPNQSGSYSFGQSSATLVETATGIATVSGSTATCTVEIPFAWTVSSTRNGVLLSYEVDALTSTSLVVRSSMQQNITEAYPTSGGTVSPSYTLTF
jgi:hypothetical protein